MDARIGLAALAGAASLVVAGCGGGGSTTTAESAAAATTTAPAAGGSAAPAKEIDVTVAGGTINGDGPVRVTIDKGTKVTLKVGADVADEVHVHGYDLHGDVAPGKPATIRFTADVPGRFEAELESHGLQILQITVNP